jgi:hypothetical protein
MFRYGSAIKYCCLTFSVLVELVVFQWIDFSDLTTPELDAIHIEPEILSVSVEVCCGIIPHFV